MQKRTLQLVIDAAKSGAPVDPDECRDTMLALHSMLARSRMVLETIADKMDNAENLFYTTRAFLGNLDTVQKERAGWMNAIPSEWLNEMDIKQREITSFWDSVESPGFKKQIT
ncbi:MAG: hypothetical protein LBS20_10975 [Prevotella sp.]|jgi:hypothetical protein|nr:hypothetical protein [Prevotella sp.]